MLQLPWLLKCASVRVQLSLKFIVFTRANPDRRKGQSAPRHCHFTCAAPFIGDSNEYIISSATLSVQMFCLVQSIPSCNLPGGYADFCSYSIGWKRWLALSNPRARGRVLLERRLRERLGPDHSDTSQRFKWWVTLSIEQRLHRQIKQSQGREACLNKLDYFVFIPTALFGPYLEPI